MITSETMKEYAALAEASSTKINAIGTHLVTPQIAAGVAFVNLQVQTRIAEALERIAKCLEDQNTGGGGDALG